MTKLEGKVLKLNQRLTAHGLNQRYLRQRIAKLELYVYLLGIAMLMFFLTLIIGALISY